MRDLGGIDEKPAKDPVLEVVASGAVVRTHHHAVVLVDEGLCVDAAHPRLNHVYRRAAVSRFLTPARARESSTGPSG